MRLKTFINSQFQILLVLTLLSFLSIPLAHGDENSREKELPRSVNIWNHPVQYLLSMRDDSEWPSDGEAFRKVTKDHPIYYVILNKAFLDEEASQLFHRFESIQINRLPKIHFTSPEWVHFEKDLFSTVNTQMELKNTITLPSRDALKELKAQLEYLAWFKIYEQSLRENRSREEALQAFIERFSQSRLKVIECHEASHILDLMNTQDISSKEFERYTELNAFYTELAYGENPYGAMAEALAGFLDEMHRRKTVDYSVEKVATILQFLKKCPRFAKAFMPGPMPKCCLELLAKINRSDFIFVGNELYRKNLHSLGQTFASLY